MLQAMQAKANSPEAQISIKKRGCGRDSPEVDDLRSAQELGWPSRRRSSGVIALFSRTALGISQQRPC
jgi:hypothetical protein